MPYSDLAETALKAARAGASIIRHNVSEDVVIEHKSTYDLVTRVDRESEKLIKEIISGTYPDHEIYAEESESEKRSSEYKWFIDPLDGTTNYVHNYPSFAVSIGVHHRNRPIAGVIIECYNRDEFVAIRNKGAYRNGQRIRVSSVNDLKNSLLVTGFDYEHGECWEMNMKLHRHFTNITQGVRRLGAAAVDLCHVATGQVDGFWEFNLNPWDSAAGVLMILEAGGIVTGMDGQEYSVFNNNIVAGNQFIHTEIIRELKKYNIKPLLE